MYNSILSRIGQVLVFLSSKTTRLNRGSNDNDMAFWRVNILLKLHPILHTMKHQSSIVCIWLFNPVCNIVGRVHPVCNIVGRVETSEYLKKKKNIKIQNVYLETISLPEIKLFKHAVSVRCCREMTLRVPQ